jgi:hypothetical protein
MVEKDIERYFVKRVKITLNGLALKFISPSMLGVPDRLVLLPEGRIIFVELKKEGGKLRQTQKVVHKIFSNLGFDVTVIDSKKKVDEFVEKWR